MGSAAPTETVCCILWASRKPKRKSCLRRMRPAMQYGAFPIFWEANFAQSVEGWFEELRATIDGENRNYLLNVNEVEYLEHVVSPFRIDPVAVDCDHPEASIEERMIPADRFPHQGFAVEPGQAYKKQVVTYHIPFSGDERLLRLAPSPRLMDTYEVYVKDGAICFDIVDFYSDPERIKNEAKRIIDLVRTQSTYLEKNIADYSAGLPVRAKQFFDARRAQVRKQMGVLEALGVPLKKASSVPRTFAVPVARKKIAIPKPAASTAPYKAEPALDESMYQEILLAIHETGRVFERLPSTYADKGEETLRDHLILQLEPRFEGSTTGETFNKAGKTDILIRCEKKNVFVAECKFWRGQKQHFETIDQILSYLTWRDSKTAIIYFVDTKDVSTAIRSIEENTPQHPCFMAFKGLKEGSWFSYEFHLSGDPGRPLQLAILCFHIPK